MFFVYNWKAYLVFFLKALICFQIIQKKKKRMNHPVLLYYRYFIFENYESRTFTITTMIGKKEQLVCARKVLIK